MQKFKLLGTALTAALVLAACGGGGGDGNQAPAVAYTSVVSFGDSLSDAGSYKTGSVAALGGGMFTVNGIAGAIGDATPPSYTWAQLIAAQAVGKANCAAWVGGFTTTPAHVAGCTNYAQGGARVTDPKGTNNPVGTGFIAGPTTVPVVTQIQNYLTDLNNGGKFSGKELVTVLAGPNDILAALTQLQTDATAQGSADFPLELAKLLAAGISPAPADSTAMNTAVTTIAQAFGTGYATNKSTTEGVMAAVHASVLLGNASVLDVAVVIATAQAYAANQTNILAAITADPTLTPQTAAAKLFVQSLTTQLIADIPVSGQAAAATAIPSAFSATYTAAITAGKTANEAQNAAVGAALQAAADSGNAKVSAIIGTSDHSILGVVGNATVAAQTYASTWAATHGPALAEIYMGTVIGAANDLVNYVKTMTTTQGAKHVIVSNLPDVSKTPHALSTIIYNKDGTIKDNSSQRLILAMTAAFNKTLADGLAGTSGVLVVDVFSEHQREIKDPAHFALTNVTDTACKLDAASNPLSSSLVCNTTNVIAGDTTHYMFADDLHPTPYEHKLLAQYVAKALVIAGWL